MESSVSVRPIAPYIGGKRNLADRLGKLIDTIPHELYVEVFMGMGGVFFRRHQAARVEVINDLSRDVAGLFRILQRHFPQFLDTLKWQLTTRADFERLMATNAEGLTDLERAARFLYLQRTAFGGKVAGRSFGLSRTAPARFDLGKLVPLLEEVHGRLTSVTIECLSYGDLIRRYDRPGALFYCDPPYVGSEGDYNDTGDLFGRVDIGHLASLLRVIKGRSIVSLNEHPAVREAFKGFDIQEVETTYSVGGGDKAKRVGELIITRL